MDIDDRVEVVKINNWTNLQYRVDKIIGSKGRVMSISYQDEYPYRVELDPEYEGGFCSIVTFAKDELKVISD